MTAYYQSIKIINKNSYFVKRGLRIFLWHIARCMSQCPHFYSHLLQLDVKFERSTGKCQSDLGWPKIFLERPRCWCKPWITITWKYIFICISNTGVSPMKLRKVALAVEKFKPDILSNIFTFAEDPCYINQYHNFLTLINPDFLDGFSHHNSVFIISNHNSEFSHHTILLNHNSRLYLYTHKIGWKLNRFYLYFRHVPNCQCEKMRSYIEHWGSPDYLRHGSSS